jgi:hypothetical protein
MQTPLQRYLYMPYGAVVITYALRIKVNEHVLIKCKSSKKTTNFLGKLHIIIKTSHQKRLTYIKSVPFVKDILKGYATWRR